MFSLVPVFIVLIVTAMNDLLDDKRGYSFHEKEMEIPFPALTICPSGYKQQTNLLPPEEAFRALSYKNGNVLPMDLSIWLATPNLDPWYYFR